MEHVDVVVVGAGISGIGAAYFLQRECADRSFVILEGRADIGGTWDLFRYPGVRSDSDMHTLGYSFKPWTAERAIADGPSIMAYLRETVAEFGIARHIRFQHLVQTASWDGAAARWTVRGTNAASGDAVALTCNFLFMCSGYYSYRHGHTPDFAGREDFAGTIAHPQQWPEDLDYRRKRVAVIGSGATAMTVVPAMAGEAAHVTMIQRSPTYVVARPDRDAIANRLRRILPDRAAYAITRFKNVHLQQFVYRRTRTRPETVKRALLREVRRALGPHYDVDRHFTPSYNPWDQRLCLIPNGDLFEAIRSGKVDVVTGHIDRFTAGGVRLVSGEEVAADLIVTATGLELVTLGEVAFDVDGAPVDFSQTWTYKGLAYSDVPNLASSFGYINASWTLRADLTCRFVCRLLNHMRQTGTDTCTPRLRRSDRDMTARPWVDDFSAGYVQRVAHLLPKQGDWAPWVNPQHYATDKRLLLRDPLSDGVMQFSGHQSLPVAQPVR